MPGPKTKLNDFDVIRENQAAMMRSLTLNNEILKNVLANMAELIRLQKVDDEIWGKS